MSLYSRHFRHYVSKTAPWRMWILVLGKSTLDFCDGRGTIGTRKRIKSVQKQPPSRYWVPKITGGIVVDLVVAFRSGPWIQWGTLTDPTSDAKTALAPIKNIAATYFQSQPDAIPVLNLLHTGKLSTRSRFSWYGDAKEVPLTIAAVYQHISVIAQRWQQSDQCHWCALKLVR